MNYSPYAMLFALMAFLWSLMTFYKVDAVAKEQKEITEMVSSFLNPQVELPEGNDI